MDQSCSMIYPPPANTSVDELPPLVVHPSERPCTTPLRFCPRNEANEPVQINGLWYYPNFLSAQEQSELLAEIHSHPWQKLIARRQQFYGEVYYHTTHKHKDLQPEKQDEKKESDCPISLDLQSILPFLKKKSLPFFGDAGFPSQVLINEYTERLGIASHFEDVEAFGPIILTISLVNPIYMTLKKPTTRNNACEKYHDIQKVLLEPGSLLVMQDDARYDYRHGISKYRWIRLSTFDQEDMCRDDTYHRVSVTIRHVLPTRRKVQATQDESSEWKQQYRY
mmetsp:Transcript_18905/g.27985  ORF Transcript_18905/g.27985 Transcript_18905/m.27985 type:complete len:280 (-) Transcript_18905:28-867(-)